MTARNLAAEFGSFEAVREAADDGDTAAFETVPDVGPTVAESIVEFFQGEGNREVLDRLLDHVDPQEPDRPDGDVLDGLTFVFTGSLAGLTRGDAQDIVERHGGSATSSVSGNTDFLVVGDNAGQTKRDDAAAEGVPQLDGRDGFESKLGEYGVEIAE